MPYAMYRSASQVSHAGTAVVDLYLGGADVTDLAPLGVTLGTRPRDDNPDAWLGPLLAMVIQASSAWSHLDKTHAARTRMKELNRRLGTRYRQRLSAEGLKQQRIREKEFKLWAASQPDGEAADPFT